jgi:hypothetical protein
VVALTLGALAALGRPYLMLLSEELGQLAVAPCSLLRQAWAWPLHQGKIVLVDRGRWHLGRTRLMGRTCWLATSMSTQGSIEMSPSLPPSLPTDVSLPLDFPLPSPVCPEEPILSSLGHCL